jgi:hypothetical protein
MSQATVGPDINVMFDATREITAQISFNTIGLVDDSSEVHNLFVRQNISLLPQLDSSIGEDFQGGRASYAINVGQTDLNSFISRQLNASNARHACLSSLSKMNNPLALSLFMARILANDTNHAGSSDDLTFSTDLLY